MSARSFLPVMVVLCLLAAPGIPGISRTQAGTWLSDWRYLPVTPHEQRDIDKAKASIEAQKDKPKFIDTLRQRRAAEIFTDRNVYLTGDGVGQIVADATVFTAWDDATAMRLTLRDAKGTAMDTLTAPMTGEKAMPKVTIRLPTEKLAAGKYSVAVEVLLKDQKASGAPVVWSFVRSAEAAPHGEIPADGVPLQAGALPAGKDGSWPISTGIPMPRGAVTDINKLVLLEDSKPIPAQWDVRSRWSPADDASARWVGLSFIARYKDGKPRDYRIKLAPQTTSSDAKLVTERDNEFEVNTGAMRFVVRRKGYDGIHTAWLGQDQVLGEGDQSGAYIVDDAGRRHAAAYDPEAQVTIEEQGPVRVVLAARGWYVAKEVDAPRLCKFVTYLIAYKDIPAVFVSHHTIIAFDTRTAKLADVGFSVPMRGAEKWATSFDGTTRQGDLKDKPVWLHQVRADRVRLMDQAEGKRADGWMSATSAKTTALCTLRDVWQKFPKEMEASKDALTLHFWPKHGIETFTDEEQMGRNTIFLHRFAHQGKLLDLQLPQRYFDTLQAWNKEATWDPEHTSDIGFTSTAEGVAIGNDFAIWLMPPTTDATVCGTTAQRFQAPPHAIADPKWNVAAGVEAPMTARDDARWPLAERTLNHDFPTCMFKLLAHCEAYGMWIYANTFNTWRGDYPGLHRVWENSHYGHVGEAWKLYFRGGSPQVLNWCRAQTDHFMNIATIHYSIPELNVRGHQPGAMHHVKGWLPWGGRHRGEFPNDSDIGTANHFVDPDSYLWRYLLEGDLFARDLYLTWMGTIPKGNYGTQGPGREAINAVAMLHNAYAMTWDPQHIPLLRGTEKTLQTPLEQAKTSVASFPVWHKRWADRYYMLTRDERVVASIAAYVRAGHWHWAPTAFAYRHLKDPTLLQAIVPRLYALSREVYRHEGDPFDGFGDYHSARDEEYMLQLPEMMEAFNQAGMDESKLKAPVGFYPPSDVCVLNPEGRDFSIKLEMPPMSGDHDHFIKVLSPSGKLVRTILIGRAEVLRVKPDATTVTFERMRFIGDKIQKVPVPAGGEKGLYTILLSGYACQVAAPMTDLPHEASRLLRDKASRPSRIFNGVLAAPSAGNVQITVTAMGYGIKPPKVPDVVYTRLMGANGKPLFDTTLLNIAAEKEASVALPTASGGADRIFPFIVLGENAVTWTGDAPYVLLAPRAEDATAVMAELAKQK